MPIELTKEELLDEYNKALKAVADTAIERDEALVARDMANVAADRIAKERVEMREAIEYMVGRLTALEKQQDAYLGGTFSTYINANYVTKYEHQHAIERKDAALKAAWEHVGSEWPDLLVDQVKEALKI